jgi:hypothetical protein
MKELLELMRRTENNGELVEQILKQAKGRAKLA